VDNLPQLVEPPAGAELELRLQPGAFDRRGLQSNTHTVASRCSTRQERRLTP